MTKPLLLGVIAEKDGMICLQTGAHCWYPLEGSSEIANQFRETFNAPSRSDIGRNLYRDRGVLQMESMEQMLARVHGGRMRTVHEFVHDFGAGAGNLTVKVPAGSLCRWHAENQCFYVAPSQVEMYARHDAEYRGIRVAFPNLERVPDDL